MNFKFDFRKQFVDNNGGVLATIEFEIHQTNSDAEKVSFSYEAEECWRTACEAGILIFADYFKRIRKDSINIRVLKVGWLPVDSSALGVLFATVEGLEKFFGIELNGLAFDSTRGLFTLPERRRAFDQ
jgi:hypothetical protein